MLSNNQIRLLKVASKGVVDFQSLSIEDKYIVDDLINRKLMSLSEVETEVSYQGETQFIHQVIHTVIISSEGQVQLDTYMRETSRFRLNIFTAFLTSLITIVGYDLIKFVISKLADQ